MRVDVSSSPSRKVDQIGSVKTPKKNLKKEKKFPVQQPSNKPKDNILIIPERTPNMYQILKERQFRRFLQTYLLGVSPSRTISSSDVNNCCSKKNIGLNNRVLNIKYISRGAYGDIFSITSKVQNGPIKFAVKHVQLGKYSSSIEFHRRILNEMMINKYLHENNFFFNTFWYVIAPSQSLRDKIVQEKYISCHDVLMVMAKKKCSLRKVIQVCRKRKEKMPEISVKKIMFHVLLQLEMLHKKAGIFHCDVKPGNVLLDAQYTPYLIDYGLACSKSNPHNSRDNEIVSLWYRPMELIYDINVDTEKTNWDVTEKVDVWSAGCIFYELFALKAPFTSNTEMELKRSIEIFRDNRMRRINSMKIWKNKEVNGLEHFKELYGMSNLAVDLLGKMLCVNVKKRITISQALSHEYFNDLKEMKDMRRVCMITPKKPFTFNVKEHDETIQNIKKKMCEEIFGNKKEK